MTCYHSNIDLSHGFIYGCVYDTGTHTHFTRLFQCLPAPVPPFDQVHSTSIIFH